METNFVREETYNEAITSKLSEHYEEILKELGEDPKREGLLKTPERVSKAMQFMTHGYGLNPDDLMNEAIFHEDYSEMVIVKNIEVYSMCEHHILPFFGKAHVAYVPDGKIVGLSKIPRVVDAYARRLQVQERLTIQIRDCIERALNPKGVAVVIECAHMCMQMRGVQKQNSVTTSSAYTGLFLNNDATRKEFINLVQAKLY
jgi:GTP cyclohydrolase I